MGAIQTYKPGISVTVHKVIKPYKGETQRYTASDNIIDLTPYLGAEGNVTTTKSIREQCGIFSITLADRIDQQNQDTLYAAISPMDYVEIRMAHDSSQYANGIYPIIMRGFVSAVRRSQEMGDDGTPRRYVIIEGQDFGKILGMLQVWYEANYGMGQNLLTAFLLTANYHVGGSSMTAAAFCQSVLDKIVNVQLGNLYAASALKGGDIKSLTIGANITVTEGTVGPYSWQAYTGPLWGLLKAFSDQYWNELFIQDTASGVELVYRPIPFRYLDGRWIGTAVDPPGRTTITPIDVKRIELSRSDADVANYFWVNAKEWQLIDAPTQKLASYAATGQIVSSDNNIDNAIQSAGATGYFLENYPNCAYALYGVRKMEVDSVQLASDETTSGFNQGTNEQDSIDSMANWITRRRTELIALNLDNIMYENGSMTVRGNENILPGTYLVIDYGAYQAEHYVYAVTHSFVPFESFTTQLQVCRGTGFSERTKLARSPYLAERGKGVYGI